MVWRDRSHIHPAGRPSPSCNAMRKQRENSSSQSNHRIFSLGPNQTHKKRGIINIGFGHASIIEHHRRNKRKHVFQIWIVPSAQFPSIWFRFIRQPCVCTCSLSGSLWTSQRVLKSFFFSFSSFFFIPLAIDWKWFLLVFHQSIPPPWIAPIKACVFVGWSF